MPFITLGAPLAHWQGHRRLPRRVIDAFPDDKLFGFSVGGMRPFGALALDDLILYVIDNESHHRGQGYVSVRALGIEPPAFYDRS
jgi:hypothetical protein